MLHIDQDTLRKRIEGDTLLGASSFRAKCLECYAEAARTWLHDEAEVVDATHLTPGQADLQIADGAGAIRLIVPPERMPNGGRLLLGSLT